MILKYFYSCDNIKVWFSSTFKDAIKAMVQQAFHLASGMNSIGPEMNDPRAMSDLIPNGKPQLSAQSSLQYTDDSQSINSFFPDQQSLTKQRVRILIYLFDSTDTEYFQLQ